MARTLAMAALLLALPAAAQERPKEEDLFGAPPAEAAPVEAAPRTAAGVATGRPAAEERVRAEVGRTDNPLQIGGLLYLRSNLQSLEGTQPGHWPLSVPTLADVFLDTRPNDRVRAFGLVRTFYDPTATTSGLGSMLQGPSQVGTTVAGAAPSGVLDQLWVKADAGHAVFFTAGRQHVKWGVGRFWSPTDFLHVAHRNPLAAFDDRTGTTMLKAHLPAESGAWNLYALAVAEPLVVAPRSVFYTPTPRASNELGALGGGARAEVLLGGWELGVDGVAQRGMDPRLGVDLSGGFWEVDLRAEVAVRRGADLPRWRLLPACVEDPSPCPVDPAGQQVRATGLRTAAVLAAEWQHKYSDEDNFTFGAEYFWNQNGYDDPHVYPELLFANHFTPFYVGRHYGGLYLLLPQPGSWNLHTFTLSVLGNLSDKSFVGRVDWSVTLLTYLTFEAYLAGHFGANGGEFRLGLDVPSRLLALDPARCAQIGGTAAGAATCATPPLQRGAPIADAGVALRVSL